MIPKYKLDGSDYSNPNARKLKKAPIHRRMPNPWKISLRNLINKEVFLGGVSILSPCKMFNSFAYDWVRPNSKLVFNLFSASFKGMTWISEI